MAKDFQAGYYKIERTGIIETMYCKCFVPISIDRWFDRVQMQFSQIHRDESFIQYKEEQIALYSDINELRFQHRNKFIFLRNVISALREEFNPVSPERIGESID